MTPSDAGFALQNIEDYKMIATSIGRLKGNAAIRGDRTKFLTCLIEERRRGFGVNAAKTFTKKVKVVMFGKSINELVSDLTDGVFVQATGDVEIESYESKTKKDDRGNPAVMSALKIVGTVQVVPGVDLPQQAQSEYDSNPAEQSTSRAGPIYGTPAAAPAGPASEYDSPPPDDGVPL